MLDLKKYSDAFEELIRLASTDLPIEVEERIRAGFKQEDEGSTAKSCLGNILENIALARSKSFPMCQDTGTNIYIIHTPVGVRQQDIKDLIQAATLEATRKGYLRPNTVDTLTGESLVANWGEGQPFFHFEQWDKNLIEITLILKGGGCENVGIQYSLPDKSIDAGRDINGIKRCLIDAVYQAQGKGCSPGVLGVGIGGDRASSYLLSKQQFKRSINSVNPNPTIKAMEEEIYKKANQLEIGPMGYEGKTTLLGVLIGAQTRIPASYFVSVSYMCWTFRRWTMTIDDRGVSYAS
jgi:fumarate hydratase class I